MNSRATVFKFISYKFEPNKKSIFFKYKIEFQNKKPLFFTETIILPIVPKTSEIPAGLINQLLKSLHIILGISYYKLYYATKIKIPYNLSKKEADFFNIVYRKGLAEFFYKNSLNPKILPQFPYQKSASWRKKINHFFLEKNDKCLVAFGGGKDSIVSVKLLKQHKFDLDAFYVQTNGESGLVDLLVKKTGMQCIKIKRVLDHKVFDQHLYNGHIPISAIYAFLGLLTAALYNYSYVIVSNEYSSNFGNLKYKGEVINHQWSKSFEFEKLFQDYISSFISPNIVYFSLLRRFYEIRIAKTFTQFKKYLAFFSSCNKNFKIKRNDNKNLWCNNCPKCLFTFTLLSAFLPKKYLVNIFGQNLYQDKKLLSSFKDVLGFGKAKPFDCVGTFEEAQTALYIAKSKFKSDFIARQLGKKVRYYGEVLRVNEESNIPEQFKLLGLENALVLGYGREGVATVNYFKKYYPELKISIADKKLDKNYLKRINGYDIVIKTPGIPRDKIKVAYTTATNIFFSQVRQPAVRQPADSKNIIIGVTGSKGKSTTCHLIFEILKKSGKKVKLVGNVGYPMLEALVERVGGGEIFIAELSSYQLSDLKFSPDIAVLTNLFPEHMDYHGNVKNYYQAKKNIINSQDKDGYFVYNPKNKEVKKWLKGYKGRAIHFAKNIPFKKEEIILPGEHNKDNIRAAISVAKIFNISDNIIKKALKNFKGLPHRLESVGQFNGIKFYNDASSTNPESAILAIKSLKNIDTIMLGGQDRGYNFSQLEKTIKKYKIRNIVIFPDLGDKILKSQKGFNIFKTKSMAKAVKFTYKNTKKEKICLLSGAAPSYSLWKNFEEKGNQFKEEVKKLSSKV